jgi:hypothetical protein
MAGSLGNVVCPEWWYPHWHVQVVAPRRRLAWVSGEASILYNPATDPSSSHFLLRESALLLTIWLLSETSWRKYSSDWISHNWQGNCNGLAWVLASKTLSTPLRQEARLPDPTDVGLMQAPGHCCLTWKAPGMGGNPGPPLDTALPKTSWQLLNTVFPERFLTQENLFSYLCFSDILGSKTTCKHLLCEPQVWRETYSNAKNAPCFWISKAFLVFKSRPTEDPTISAPGIVYLISETRQTPGLRETQHWGQGTQGTSEKTHFHGRCLVPLALHQGFQYLLGYQMKSKLPNKV